MLRSDTRFRAATMAIVVCAAMAGGATYYVSSEYGSDSFGGTTAYVAGGDGPFGTLAYAVRQIGEGDTLMVRAGTYDESVYVQNGHRDRPVRIQAAMRSAGVTEQPFCRPVRRMNAYSKGYRKTH